MTILACGPYIGSFEQEIITFRPYTNWLCKVVEHDKVYLNTHSNRLFLYENFIPRENMIPVFENLSRDERSQTGYIHKSIKQSDYNIIVRKFKEEIVKREKCVRKDIKLYHLDYLKSTPPYSIYNKSFDKIQDPNNINIPENKIVFVPVRNEDEQKMRWIYTHLLRNYGDELTIIGDENTYFKKDNSILQQIDYFENGWKRNIKYIINAKALICPVSYWTTIANMQSIPVFSWGDSVSQHKEGGIYHFSNENSAIIPTTETTGVGIIIEMIDYFLRGL